MDTGKQYTPMTPVYQWDTVNSPEENAKFNVIEIAAAPITGTGPVFSGMTDKTSCFLNGEMKEYGEGDPASNFRYKACSEENNIAIAYIKEIMDAAKVSGSQVYFPSFSRDDRYVTFKMEADGDFSINSELQEDMATEKAILDDFLRSNAIGPEQIKRIRLSSKGAGFRTKLADIQSFLLQVDALSEGKLMENQIVTLHIIQPTDLEVSERPNVCSPLPLLRPMKLQNGRDWNPVEGCNYLYFEMHHDCEFLASGTHTYMVQVPVKGAIDKIYQALWEALNNKENEVKKSIRDHFKKVKGFHRWSDYSVNDTDDAFTILTIIRAYEFVDLTENETFVRDKFQEIIKPWVDDLYN